MKILVTGGCGFIGANLVPFLIKSGYDIIVLDNLSRGNLDYLNGAGNFDFIKGDIRNISDIRRSMKNVDAVIHLAAYGSVVESLEDPRINFEINGYGTLNVLQSSVEYGVSKLIFASTGGALIGDAKPPVSEESVARPKSPYGASKLTGEAYCHAYGQTFNLPVVILRFANIYGPVSAHKKGAITAFSKALISNRPLVIYGDGTASRDFLHVNDLANGILLALDRPLPPATVLHLATGRETSIEELADILRNIAGKPGHPMEYCDSRAGEVYRNFAHYKRASEMLGFEPNITLKDGLRKTWSWFIQQDKAILEMETTDS